MGTNLLINSKSALGSRKKFYLTYSGLFLVLSFFVFSFFLFSGKSFVWQPDGFFQHLKALTYYAQWLRQLVRNLLFEHCLSLPEFSLNMGLGADVITTLHYYAIGDPFNLLSVFVPSRYMEYFYSAMILVRLYFCGLFFSLFCFNKGIKNQYGVLAGAFVYAFCGFSLYAAVRHPYFTNPMVFLPLLLIGVDHVLAKKRPYLLILTVGVATVSNFYFLYLLALFTVVYVIGQLILLYRHSLKEMWKPFFQLVGCAVLGALLGAVLLLPVLQVLFSDNRASVGTETMLLYPLNYYSALPAAFLAAFTPGYWTLGGFAAIALPAVFLLFMKKKQWTFTKILFVLGCISMLIPAAGTMFNGFSYTANRWSFGFAFVVAFIVAAVWPQLITLTKKEAVILFVCVALYATVAFCAEKSRIIAFFASLAIGVAGLAVMMFLAETPSARLKRIGQRVLVVLTMVGIFVNAFWLYSVQGANYSSQFLDFKSVSDKTAYTPDVLVKSVSKENDDESFFRYSGRSLQRNSSLLHGTSSTQYYWSLSSPAVADFQREMSMREPMSQLWDGLDDRTALMTLASVRYYTLPDSDTASIPYGMEKVTAKNINSPVVEEILEAQAAELGRELTEQETKTLTKRFRSRYAIYENRYTLPLGYTYDSYITRQQYEQLTALEKQEALLQSAVLEEAAALPQNEQLSFTGVEIPYTVECANQQVTAQGNSFVVTQGNATVNLLLEDAVVGETYLSVEGLTFKGVSGYEIYNSDTAIDPQDLYTQTIMDTLTSTQQDNLVRSDRFYKAPSSLTIKVNATHTDNKKSVTKNLEYHAPDYSWYNARHDFEINLGYNENAAKMVSITLPSLGTYSFDSLKVICQPMENYGRQVEALKEDVLENVSMDTDKITGTISLETPKLLCLSIPYSKGWTAYVDGEPAQLLQTNTMYMGLSLPAGQHSIRLIYQTPGLRLGMAVSGVAVVILLGLVFVQEILPHMKKRNKTKDVSL